MRNDPPVLRRLGPVPFWRGEQKCLSVLEPIYRRAMENAHDILRRVPVEGNEENDGKETAK
jgi:hypothetical protein